MNTVNTVGIMGRGIALQFKQAYPAMVRDYERACKAGELKLGKVQVFDLGGLVGGPRWIINFPTKGHWRADSRMEDIEAGLKDLVATIRKLRIRSIAIPPLGCGNGGLDWNEVRPRIEAAMAEMPEVEALVLRARWSAGGGGNADSDRASEDDDGPGGDDCADGPLSKRVARPVHQPAGDSQADVFLAGGGAAVAPEI